mgnify:CR=1 FL=1
MSYYTDLGILPTASMEEISIAYNNLMSEDIDLDDKIRYNKSFATLENYNSRRKYDNLMEANTKVVTAYNNETFYSFLSINNESSNNEHIQNKNDNIQNNNDITDIDTDTSNNILNKIEKLFLDLNIRLESIETKIYSNEKNNNNFYKERKKINTKWNKGKKIVNILTDVNNNGDLSRKLKTIGYDSDGNEEIKYKTFNNDV